MATADTDIEPSNLPNISLNVPEDINSPVAKLVYVYVHALGSVTVQDIRDSLNLTNMTLLGILPTLREKNYVQRDGDVLQPGGA